MGREMKKVPIDFNWPLNKVWKGYINPFTSTSCAACEGSGLNPATKKLSDDWYTHLRTDGQEGWQHHLDKDDVRALLRADRLWDFTRVPLTEKQRETVRRKVARGGNSWLPKSNGYIPTADEVNAWSRRFFGHDSINQMICVKAKAKRLGIYGLCATCKGEGDIWESPKTKKLSQEWEMEEPPVGDGYQLWETTSEGSPVSPVFRTLDDLCQWAENNATTFATGHASAEEWKEMLQKNFVYRKEGNAIFM